jgi:hypothetical protein
MSVQQSNESFGIATRIGSSNSEFQFEATKVIHSIVAFSPAPDTMAAQFLIELEKVKGMSSLGKHLFCILSHILLVIQSLNSEAGFKLRFGV